MDAPEEALEGFIKSNNLNKSDIYKKKIEKGEFYFAETKPKIIDILAELQIIIPEISSRLFMEKINEMVFL